MYIYSISVNKNIYINIQHKSQKLPKLWVINFLIKYYAVIYYTYDFQLFFFLFKNLLRV